jgi:hypothetical protein
MLGRRASRADTVEVVALAHEMKRRLAGWSPTYFRPREGAEERHAAFLGYLIGSADHTTVVLEHDGRPAGFFAIVPQPSHRWVDDLYLADPGRWPDAIDIIDAHVDAPWVTCVSRFDEPRAAALRDAGLELRSTYWARPLTGRSTASGLDVLPSTVTPAGGPAHTFGGAPFDPRVPGALTGTAADGYVIGSPSVEPPLYDPGGPSCIVDRIVGPDRASLLDAAMAAAAERGDAGMVVVSDIADEALQGQLASAGFRAEVDLFARDRRRGIDPTGPPRAEQ